MIVPVSRLIRTCKFFSAAPFLVLFLLQLTVVAGGQKISANKKSLTGKEDEVMNTPTWTSDNGNGTYTNPIFYDEFSDPDMIRVGNDYYLTGTTNHAMPGLPLLRSKDLLNWEFICYVSDKLDFGPAYRLQDGKDIYG